MNSRRSSGRHAGPGLERCDMREIIYGINPVAEALAARRRTFYRIIVSEKKRNRRIIDIKAIAENAGIDIRKVSHERLSSLIGHESHQGIAAETSGFPVSGLDRLLYEIREMETQNAPLMLLADSISDTGNLGAIIRTAVCANASAVIIPKNRSAQPTPAVSKASAGAMEHARICRVPNLSNAISKLKKEGFWIIGMDMNAESTIYETDMTGPVGLVIGGEDSGIRPLVRNYCDFICRIPQTGPINSLNTSAACAVAIYESVRQKYAKGRTNGR